MNRIDLHLERLLRAASLCAAPAIPGPAFGLETRVVSAWREAQAATDDWYLPVFLRGLVLAGAVMTLSLLSLLAPATASADEDHAQLADSTVQNLSP
jgi:hypothetical protein